MDSLFIFVHLLPPTLIYSLLCALSTISHIIIPPAAVMAISLISTLLTIIFYALKGRWWMFGITVQLAVILGVHIIKLELCMWYHHSIACETGNNFWKKAGSGCFERIAAFGHTVAQAITPNDSNDNISLPPPYQISHFQPFQIQLLRFWLLISLLQLTNSPINFSFRGDKDTI
jgi:hypothetical protein